MARWSQNQMAAEYVSALSKYEDTLHELKLLCSAASRPTKSVSSRPGNTSLALPPPRSDQSPPPPRIRASTIPSVQQASGPFTTALRSAQTDISVSVDEVEMETLSAQGAVSAQPRPFDASSPDDLAHVKALFLAQVPHSEVLGVWRVENAGLSAVYEAVSASMAMSNELSLWHGTTADSLRNIVLNGFNRAYCGRHGTRLGHGTYFSMDAAYSVRFCDRRKPNFPNPHRIMFLAKVLVGAWDLGRPGLVEPDLRDATKGTRFDSTVDDVASPTMFCVFRDFQAIPCYVIKFTGGSVS